MSRDCLQPVLGVWQVVGGKQGLPLAAIHTVGGGERGLPTATGSFVGGAGRRSSNHTEADGSFGGGQYRGGRGGAPPCVPLCVAYATG